MSWSIHQHALLLSNKLPQQLGLLHKGQTLGFTYSSLFIYSQDKWATLAFMQLQRKNGFG